MTAPEHDPAVSMWEVVIGRIRRNLFADEVCAEARSAGFAPRCVNVGRGCTCRQPVMGPPKRDNLPDLDRLEQVAVEKWTSTINKLLVLHEEARKPLDMPDRWEGDDS